MRARLRVYLITRLCLAGQVPRDSGQAGRPVHTQSPFRKYFLKGLCEKIVGKRTVKMRNVVFGLRSE